MSGAAKAAIAEPVEKLVGELEMIGGMMVMLGMHVPHEDLHEEWWVWFGRNIEALSARFEDEIGRTAS
jgi:hypothetical protein